MKILRLVLLPVLLTFWLCAPGVTAKERYVPLPPSLDGSMMPYDFSACTQIPYLPDSLTPIYASYVARHGARYLSGPNKISPLIKRLEKARTAGHLNAHGDRFLSLLEKIRDHNAPNWGDLSPTGVSEEKRLADRLHRTIPVLSDPGTHVKSISSYVPRVVMTMYQFGGALVRLNDRITCLTDEGKQFSPLVRCFSTDSSYAAFRKEGDWRAVYDQFVNDHVSGAPAARLFESHLPPDKDLREMTMEMYEILKGNRASGLPAPTTEWMNVDEYRSCWRASNLSHYLRNSISPISDAAARATSPLMLDIIDKTDEALATGNNLPGRMPKPTVNAWFGHAETLLPLLSLMRLPGCFDMPLDYDTLDKCWRIQEITPLGANLLLLIARAPSGRDYACVQLNGRTVQPIKGHPDVVPWSELREYWLHQVRSYER